jgi:hypothetical protein
MISHHIFEVSLLQLSATLTIIHISPIAKIFTNNQGRKLANPDHPDTSLPLSRQVVCNPQKFIQLVFWLFGSGVITIHKKSRVLLSLSIAGFIASCSVCNMMILILIANTGNTGANISHNILHPLTSAHHIFIPPHGILISSLSP